MPVVTPLLNPAPDAPRPGIEVRRGDRLLADPHAVEVRLVNEGRRDIPSAAFDQRQPLILDVGAPIVEILKIASSPEREVLVTVQGASVKIGPALIVRRQEISLSLLVDGAASRLTCPQPPLIDIDVRYGESATSLRWRWWTAALGALVVTLVVLLNLPSDTPTGSVGSIHNAYIANIFSKNRLYLVDIKFSKDDCHVPPGENPSSCVDRLTGGDADSCPPTSKDCTATLVNIDEGKKKNSGEMEDLLRDCLNRRADITFSGKRDPAKSDYANVLLVVPSSN